MENFFEKEREKISTIAIALLLALFINNSLWLIVESFTEYWGIHIALVIGGIIGVIVIFSGFTLNTKSIRHGVIGGGAILLFFGLGTLILPKYLEFKTGLVGLVLALFLWIGIKNANKKPRLKNAPE